ncbi:outer membrane protein [Salibaculum halophilum]|uniref:outer membrane protein n=1 Tax=Salibaculum halophilum TaxID=1914408 RepID=UPI0015C49D5A|nr:outer membrane beta-barrel protein [Salibaculum halophilum]
MKLLTTTLFAFGLASGAVLAESADEATSDPATSTPELDTVMDWSGAYVGGILSFGSGVYGNDAIFPGDGEGELSGPGVGGLVGYNFQNSKFVYGAELALSASRLHGTEECNNPDFECALEFSTVGSLRLRGGYLASSDTLIYGLAGVAAGDADGFVDDGSGPEGEVNRLNGTVFGIGVERAFKERLRGRIGINRYTFDGQDFQTDQVYPDVSSSFNELEAAIIYSF